MDLSQFASALVEQENAQAAGPGVRGFGYMLPPRFGYAPLRKSADAWEGFRPRGSSRGSTRSSAARIARPALLATTLWQAMLSSGRFVAALGGMGIHLPSAGDGRVMIVMHEDETLTRYDLMVLSPKLLPQQSTSLPLASLLAQTDLSGSEVASFLDDWQQEIQVQLTQLHQRGELSVEELEQFLALYRSMASIGGATILEELFREQPFSLMAAPMPRMIRTDNVPDPAVGITLLAGGALSCSVGVVTKDTGGRAGVTTCLHGVVPDPDLLYDDFNKYGAACVVGKTVYVDGAPGTIETADLITDSCFIEVNLPAVVRAAPVKGPMRGRSPYQAELVSFHGKVSRKQETAVNAVDRSIPIVARGEQAKVYTKAVTNPGDSGAALVNGDGFVIGFCHRRTGLGEPIEFAEWIWADSVYMRSKLERT